MSRELLVLLGALPLASAACPTMCSGYTCDWWFGQGTSCLPTETGGCAATCCAACPQTGSPTASPTTDAPTTGAPTSSPSASPTLFVNVSGGSFASPTFYTFSPSTPTLLRGSTYEFVASGVAAAHPFMVGESRGVPPPFTVDGSGSGHLGGLVGSAGSLRFTVPDSYAGSLMYYCTVHASINHNFTLADAAPPPESSPPSPPPGAPEVLPDCPLTADGTEADCRFAVRATSGPAYTINGLRQAELTLVRGRSYTFDVQTASVHSFAFSLEEEGERYLGVDGPGGVVCGFERPGGVFDRDVRLNPGTSTPGTLHYRCENPAHPGMGAKISIVGGEADECPSELFDVNATQATASAEFERSRFLYYHGAIMYTAFGVLLPMAAFMAHIGRQFTIRGRTTISVHKLLAPSSVLVGVVGLSMAVVGLDREGAKHFNTAHSTIGIIVLSAAVFSQPVAMIAGWRTTHRRQGAAIIIAGFANIIQGMVLLQVALGLQVAQVVLMALLLFGYVLYQPSRWQTQNLEPLPAAAPRLVGETMSTTDTRSATSGRGGAASCGDVAPTVGSNVFGGPLANVKSSVAPAAVESARMDVGRTMEASLSHHKEAVAAQQGAAGASEGRSSKAEQALLKSLPSKVALTGGVLTRATLRDLLDSIAKANRLTLGAEDLELLVTALLAVGDTDGDGEMAYSELQALLAVRGLALHAEGKLARAPVAEPEPRVDELSPAQSTEDLLPSFGPGDDHYNELTRLERIGRKVEDALPAFFALTLWIIGNVVGFVVYFGEYACWFETDANGGAGCVAAPLAVCFAKGAGMCLNINCALIVLPMCRRFLTWLRSIRPVRRAVPLDLAYDAHIVLGWTIAAFTFVHVTCHYINYASTPTPEDAIATDAGATGHGLLLILLLMCVTALPRFRRGAKFHVFILTHHLFVIFFFLLFVHGTGFVGPNFWKIGTWPLLLYFWERATRLSNTDYRHALRVVRCERLRGRVTLLQFEKPAGFRYLPGQYCFVAVPALAAGSPVHALEFHPFTISSAPHEPYVSLHIRSAGDWTSALHKLASAGDAKSKVDLCLMDGPYGSASEQVYDYDVSVMVGAGIGVTPFASILKDMRHKLDCLNSAGVNLEQLRHVFEVIMGGGAHRAKGAGSIQSRSTLALQKLYFFWTTREQGAFEWFGDLLSGLNSSSVSSQPTKGGGGRRSWELEICTYVTGLRSFEKGPTDLGSLFLKMALDLVLEATGKDLLTGSMSNQGTRFERPRWDDIFGGLARDHAGCSIGVFFCGPARLGAVLNEKCRDFNERPEAAARQTRFTFHTEVF